MDLTSIHHGAITVFIICFQSKYRCPDITPKDITPKDITPKDITPKADITPKCKLRTRKLRYCNQLCSHTPSALNAGAKRSGATCHMAMPQCCYLAKGAKRPSHTTNMLTSSNNNLKKSMLFSLNSLISLGVISVWA